MPVFIGLRTDPLEQACATANLRPWLFGAVLFPFHVGCSHLVSGRLLPLTLPLSHTLPFSETLSPLRPGQLSKVPPHITCKAVLHLQGRLNHSLEDPSPPRSSLNIVAFTLALLSSLLSLESAHLYSVSSHRALNAEACIEPAAEARHIHTGRKQSSA